MKVKSLYLENYKIFKKLSLDFTDKDGKTLDTIVFAGDNGSGKTTILNLFYTILTPREIENPLCDYLQVTLEFTDVQKKLIFKILDSDKKNKFLKESLRINSLKEKFSGKGDITLEYKLGEKIINDFLVFNLLEEQKEISNKNGLKLLYTNKEIDEKLDNPEFTSMIKNNIQEYYKNRDLKQLEKKAGIYSDFSMHLKLYEILEDKIFFRNINNTKIQMEDLSSGEKQILYRFFYLENSGIEKGMIVVDEPENSLHPKWQQKIIQLYHSLEKSNQVILATHSPHIISAISPVSLFILKLNDTSNQVEAINIGKSNKQTKGLEPNRILLEIMGTPLRDPETQDEINTLLHYIKNNTINTPEAKRLIIKLRKSLGTRDPFIMRMEHQLRILNQ